MALGLETRPRANHYERSGMVRLDGKMENEKRVLLAIAG
jgi:hypothetical protein